MIVKGVIPTIFRSFLWFGLIELLRRTRRNSQIFGTYRSSIEYPPMIITRACMIASAWVAKRKLEVGTVCGCLGVCCVSATWMTGRCWICHCCVMRRSVVTCGIFMCYRSRLARVLLPMHLIPAVKIFRLFVLIPFRTRNIRVVNYVLKSFREEIGSTQIS